MLACSSNFLKGMPFKLYFFVTSAHFLCIASCYGIYLAMSEENVLLRVLQLPITIEIVFIDSNQNKRIGAKVII